MSPAHFSRRFRPAHGETPYSYLMTRRIERAKALLRRGDMSVTEVSFAVGCTSLGSFALGLQVRTDVSAEVMRRVTLSPPDQPDVEILLVESAAGRPADAEPMLALLTKGSLNAANFRTQELDPTLEKIRASGAEVLQEPADQFWGVRDCAFATPPAT